MVPGKERVPAPDQHEAPETVQDVRWLNGVNRQLRPDAAAQRLAASQAAAAKRTANAMPEDERKAKRRQHAKEVRERQRAERAAAAAEPAAEPAAELAAQPAAEPEVEPAATAPPVLDLFNQWLHHDGYEQAGPEEWQDFQDDGAFEDAEPEDLQPAALIELFLEWRDSDRHQAAHMDMRVADFVLSGMNLARPQPPPVQPRAGWQPERAVAECASGAPDDDDPYHNPGAWAQDMVGPSGWQDSPRSPPADTGDDDYWENFVDHEYARAAGEVGWFSSSNWGEPQESAAQQQVRERQARKMREQAAGPPPDRDEPRYGPRGDTAGSDLFRRDRESWYERFAGQSIKGATLQDQNDLCDKIRRRFRSYSDGRTERPTDSTLISAPKQQRRREHDFGCWSHMPEPPPPPPRTPSPELPLVSRRELRSLPTADVMAMRQQMQTELERCEAKLADLEQFRFVDPTTVGARAEGRGRYNRAKQWHGRLQVHLMHVDEVIHGPCTLDM